MSPVLLIILVSIFIGIAVSPLFLPFRAKNPPEHFPYCTLGLIIVNTIIFALTSVFFVAVRPEAVAAYALTHNNLSPFHLVSAMFLHGSFMHLAGNMLFLWVFGASVEGRLRPLNFLAMYFFSGIGGGLLHDILLGVNHPDLPGLGASGAIMGVAGAYLYLFPFSIIRMFGCWLMFRIFGRMNWQARWVILLFIGLDVLNGVILHKADGVAHLVHIGGFAMGLLSAFLIGAPRDNEDYSDAQAVVADTHDLSMLNIYDLEALMGKPSPEPRVVLAYCDKALTSVVGGGEQKCLAALQHHGRLLGDQADPVDLATLLLRLSPTAAKAIPMIFYLRLGSRLERAAANELAIRVYYLMGEINPQSPDYEAALMRLAHLAEQAYGDQEMAKGFYRELMQRFPNGQMAGEAHRALAQMARPGPSPSPAR